VDEHTKPIMRKPARVAFSVLTHLQLLFVIHLMTIKTKNCFHNTHICRIFKDSIQKKCELDGLNTFKA
jgi:hypothetical protein